MDKVQKIREKIESRIVFQKECIKNSYRLTGKPEEEIILEYKQLLSFIDSLQKKEPKFKIGDVVRFKGNETIEGEEETHKIVGYDNELYIFDNGTTDLFCEQDLYELVEESVSDKFEKTFISFVNATHDHNCSYSLHDFAQRLYNIAKEELKEPVSEPNKELAETYLTVFNKKFPILPSLSGKQLADYKNFLNKCQQIFGLKEWGIRPIQSKLFEKLTLLWAAWGAEHLQGVSRQDEKEQDIPVSGDLEEAMQHNAPNNIGIDDLLYWRNGFITGAGWGKNQAKIEIQTQSIALAHGCPKEVPVGEDLEEAGDVYSKVFSDIAAPYIRKDAFIAGANWQKEQDLIPSTELSNFIDKLSKQFPEVSFAKLSRIAVRVAKWQQQQEYTCYEEAFEDGAKWKYEQMMKGAINAKIGSFTNGTIYDADFNIDSNLKDSDKVKVIVIKED